MIVEVRAFFLGECDCGYQLSHDEILRQVNGERPWHEPPDTTGPATPATNPATGECTATIRVSDNIWFLDPGRHFENSAWLRCRAK